jgi:hypothetical protein
MVRAMRLVAVVLLAGCAPTRVVVTEPIPPPARVAYRCDPWPLPEGAKLDPATATRYLNEMGAKGWDSFVGNDTFVCFKRYLP